MPSNFVTLPEIQRVARQRLSRDVWNFGAGRSEAETTLGLCGQTSIRGLRPDLVLRVEYQRQGGNRP